MMQNAVLKYIDTLVVVSALVISLVILVARKMRNSLEISGQSLWLLQSQAVFPTCRELKAGKRICPYCNCVFCFRNAGILCRLNNRGPGWIIRERTDCVLRLLGRLSTTERGPWIGPWARWGKPSPAGEGFNRPCCLAGAPECAAIRAGEPGGYAERCVE